MSPLITYIIPVFNCEKYLSGCLDSILQQTIENIEVICINDCSTDGSLEILDLYAKKDSRIKILNNTQNLGPGPSRNRGIEKAKGKYLRIIDGDDFIPKDSTEKLVIIAEEHGSAFVRGGFKKYFPDSDIQPKKGARFPDKQIINASIKKEKLLWYFDQHTTYLYTTRIVKENLNCRYSEDLKNGEDVAFLVNLFPYMERVSLIPETVYCYRQSPSSAMRGKKDKQYYLNLFQLYEMEYDVLGPKGFREQVDHYMYYRFSSILPYVVLPSIPDNLEDDEAYEVLTDLKGKIDTYTLDKLCFSSAYSWREERHIPLLSRKMLIMLSGGYIKEALETIKENQQHVKNIKALKKRNSSLVNSTSWRLTRPLRFIIDSLR